MYNESFTNIHRDIHTHTYRKPKNHISLNRIPYLHRSGFNMICCRRNRERAGLARENISQFVGGC